MASRPSVSVESGVVKAFDRLSLHEARPLDRLVGHPGKRRTQAVCGNRLARDHQHRHEITPPFAHEREPPDGRIGLREPRYTSRHRTTWTIKRMTYML